MPIFLEFSKTFDFLSHSLNIENWLGKNNIAKQWFESCLKGRRQLVKIRHTSRDVTWEIQSYMIPTDKECHQNLLRGHLFDLFTISYMPQYLDQYCTHLLEADYTTLLPNGKASEDITVSSYTVNMVYQYCYGNNLAVKP